MFTERKTHHFWHFVMFMLTGGLWLPVWFLCWWSNQRHNERQAANFRELVAGTRAPVNVTVTQTTAPGSSQAGRVHPALLPILAALAVLALFVLMALTYGGHV